MMKWFFKDFWIKLISIGIAIALWFFVNSKKPRDITCNVSLVPPVVPAGMVVKEVLPGKAKVTLRGNLESLFIFNVRTVKLNLSCSIKGDTEVPCEILPQNLSIPQGIEVVKIEPGRAIVKIKKIK